MILVKNSRYRIPKIQSTELKKVNKLKGPREDASVPLGREKNAVTVGREGPGRDLGGKVDRPFFFFEGREGNLIWYWVRENN